MTDGRISNFMQIAGIRRYELTEGPEKGLRVLDCDNGKLRFLLNESKALDMLQLYHEGQNVSFLSVNGCTMREVPFGARFEGGMLYTCGLDSVGEREGYELHGSHHNVPAKVLRAECDETGIMVEAEIRESALFGRNLVLRRKIFSGLGSERVEICDTLENRAFREENYCLLYHVNVGYPMLDEGARLIGAVKQVTPRTEWAKENRDACMAMTAPAPEREEMCYFLALEKPEIALENRTLRKKFTLSWSGDTLPCFVEWKSMASGNYALGLEPSTTELDERFRYRTIRAGEKVAFRLCMCVQKI